MKDLYLLNLAARFFLINILPFFLVFRMVMRRRKAAADSAFSEVNLIAGELMIVGIMGYYVILSIYFFSIPVLKYLDEVQGYDILLVEPDGSTIFLIAFISYALVVSSIYLNQRRRWAYYLAQGIIFILLIHAFFTILDIGLIAIVPVAVFSYLLYRLTRPSLKMSVLGELKH